MNPNIFSHEEQQQLFECVLSIKELPIYGSEEFEAIFGLSEHEVSAVLQAFPKWDLYDEDAEGVDHSQIVLHNAFAWLLDGREEDRIRMRSKLTFPESELDALYNKFRRL